MRPSTLFFGCRMSESRLGKLASKSVDGHYAQFSIGKHTFEVELRGHLQNDFVTLNVIMTLGGGGLAP